MHWIIRSAIGFTVLFAGPAVSQAAIYTWSDGQGVRHYSDTEHNPNAHIANLPGVSGISDTRAGRQSPAPATNDRVAIVSPHDGQVIRDHGQGVSISVMRVGDGQDNTLKPDQTLQYYLDGHALLKSPTTARQLTLKHLPPGQHKLRVALLNKGREVQRTGPVTFTLKNAGSPKKAGNQAAASAGSDN